MEAAIRWLRSDDNLFAALIDLLGMRNHGLAFCPFYPCSQCQKFSHRGFEIEVGPGWGGPLGYLVKRIFCAITFNHWKLLPSQPPSRV